MRVVSPSLFKRNFPRDNRPFKDKKVGLRRQKYNFLSRNKASDGAKCEGPDEIFRIFGCVIGAGVDAYLYGISVLSASGCVKNEGDCCGWRCLGGLEGKDVGSVGIIDLSHHLVGVGFAAEDVFFIGHSFFRTII